jgi:hypothetical protein
MIFDVIGSAAFRLDLAPLENVVLQALVFNVRSEFEHSRRFLFSSYGYFEKTFIAVRVCSVFDLLRAFIRAAAITAFRLRVVAKFEKAQHRRFRLVYRCASG